MCENQGSLAPGSDDGTSYGEGEKSADGFYEEELERGVLPEDARDAEGNCEAEPCQETDEGSF